MSQMKNAHFESADGAYSINSQRHTSTNPYAVSQTQHTSSADGAQFKDGKPKTKTVCYNAIKVVETCRNTEYTRKNGPWPLSDGEVDKPYTEEFPDGFLTGVCKWYNYRDGYGFIVSDIDGIEVFVHHGVIKGRGFRCLLENERVQFTYKRTDKGLEATRVTGPGGHPVKGVNYCPENENVNFAYEKTDNGLEATKVTEPVEQPVKAAREISFTKKGNSFSCNIECTEAPLQPSEDNSNKVGDEQNYEDPNTSDTCSPPLPKKKRNQDQDFQNTPKDVHSPLKPKKEFDADKSFLLSFLPDLKKMDDGQKLDLKIEFLKTVKRISNPLNNLYIYN